MGVEPLKRLKVLLVLSVLVAVAFSVVGCGGRPETKSESTGDKPKETEAPSKPVEKTDVVILTYGSGGSNYIQAGGMAKVAEKYLENTVATVQPTGGDLEMVRLLDQRKGDFAFVMLNSAFQAYHGDDPYDRAYDGIRLFLVGQNALVHLVVPAKSPIKSVEDLKGKKVSIGTPGSSCANYMVPTVLEAYGMTLDDIKAQQISINDAVAALKDGTIDAGFFYLIPPAPALTDLSTTNPIRLIPISDEARSAMAEKDKLLDFEVIKAGTYQGMTEDALAVGLSCCIITHKDVPDKVVYGLAKALDEHMEDWKEVHAGSQFYTPEKTAKYAAIPIHPGMEKYIEEKGIE